MSAPPVVNRRILEALLVDELKGAPQHRLVLVHGRYESSAPTEFCIEIDEVPRRVRVTDQPSVLGIVEAWQEHHNGTAGRDDVLVVTTGVDDAQLSWDLRGHALHRSTRTVDRSRIIARRFGAVEVDPRIRAEGWLVEALLDAEPTGGWPRCGSVLTRDFAIRALIEARLGEALFGAGAADGPDTDVLLAWSRTPVGPARFARLSDAERAGITEWLTETVGAAVPVLLGLVEAGRGADAMALGVLGSVLTDPGAGAEAALSFGGLLSDLRFRPVQLRAFTDAVEKALQRWITEAAPVGAAGGSADGLSDAHAHGNGARQRVLDVVQRADELAAAVGLTEALVANRFLPSSFQARLRLVAAALSTRPPEAAAAAAEKALSELLQHGRHGLAALHPQRSHTARMAVRLARWLATPEPRVGSVAAGVHGHLNDWGWVDRALNVVWAGDPVDDPLVGQGYRTVYEAARARRDALDEAFAQCLRGWTEYACSQAPGGCLLVEDVLARFALPLAAGRAPLLLLLDAMSSAVATELGDQLARQSWTEVSPESPASPGSPGSPRVGPRTAAVAALPSVTMVSRASLLTAGLTSGDQASEQDGFAAFWRRHRRDAALFHKGEIGGHAGSRLAEPLVAALAGDGVVGVVLNTIDDALQHGREGDRLEWRPADVTYLPELLNAARSYGRPVVLVSDHGHVLERSAPGTSPVLAPGAESARWRTGEPAPGEVALAGPRVRYGDGRIVAPWREDIHYTHRRSGYHGGASLAEMTVPVLVLLPSAELLPSGWSVLPPETVAPAWWAPGQTEGVTRQTGQPAEPAAPEPAATAAAVPPVRRKGKAVRQPEGVPELFTVEAVPAVRAPSTPTADAATPSAPAAVAAAPSTLGSRVVATEIYAGQRGFVRKAPDKAVVATVIDKLVAADGTLSLTAVAAAAGRAGRNPDGFAATLQRLLNVEGYAVLGVVDGGRTLRLDQELLRQQFGLGSGAS